MNTNKEDFLKELIPVIRNKLGDDYYVSTSDIIGNNGVCTTSIDVQKKKKNNPKIIIDGFYKSFEKGDAIEDIADRIICRYNEAQNDMLLTEGGISEWNKIKDKLSVKVISAERNADYLDSLVWRKYLDFAVVPIIVFNYDFNSFRAVNVSTNMAENWGIDYNTIIDTAITNSKTLFSCTARNLNEAFPGGNWEEIYEEHPWKIITSKYYNNGSAGILDKELLDGIYREYGCLYYILPLSVNELIVVPYDGVPVDELKELSVYCASQITDTGEVLSDNIYVYNGSCLEIL